MKNRIGIAVQAATVAAILASSASAAQEANPRSENMKQLTQDPMGGDEFGHSVKSLGKGLYVFRWRTHRNIFIVTDDGVIVTDPMNPKAAELLHGEIRKVTDKSVKYVVYSHNHHDHISGGNIFEKEGASFVGHENLLKELADHPSPVIPLPDITFKDSYQLKLGGRTLELAYFGPNHGDSLVVMRLPDERILFIVDIVTPRRVAFRTMPDFWPDEWVRSLKEIEKMDFDYVICGHGPQDQPPIDPASVVTEQRIYLQELMAAVKEAMDSGTRSPDALIPARRKQLADHRWGTGTAAAPG